MRKTLALLLLTAAVGTAALAHTGVKNPAVLARMDGMSALAQQAKTLGGIAKGAQPFDAALVTATATAMAVEAGRIEALFTAPEDDPKTEALPGIWTNFSDFTAKAVALETVAQEAASAASVAELGAAMRAIGAACKDCHALYRK